MRVEQVRDFIRRLDTKDLAERLIRQVTFFSRSVKNPSQMGIKFKAIVLMIVFVVAISAILTAFVLWLERNALYQEKKAKGETIVSNLLSSNAEDLIVRDWNKLKVSAENGLNDEADVVYVLIKDVRSAEERKTDRRDEQSEEDAIFRTKISEEKELKQAVQNLNQPDKDILEQRLVWHKKSIIDLAKPLYTANNKYIGFFQIGLSEESIEKAIAVARKKVIFVTLVIVLTFCLISWPLIARVVKPVIQLTNFARSLGEESNLGQTIGMVRKDEIGILAEALNWLSQRIKTLLEEVVDKVRLEQELNNAKVVQEHLLQKELPKIEGAECGYLFKPAGKLSGDFYEGVNLGNGNYGFYVADVSGKGQDAALIMSSAMALMAMAVEESLSPRSVLIKVQKVLRIKLPTGRYVTLVYLVYRAVDNKIVIASAGHPHVLLIKKTGIELADLKNKGMALGRQNEAEFSASLKEEEIQLIPGEGIFLFTDGVNETKSPAGEQFGRERIKEFLAENQQLALPEIMEGLNAKLSAFRQKEERGDDITMLMVKVADGQS